VDEAAFLERLTDYEVKMKTEAHAFDLFGLPLDADRKSIRSVWTELSTRFHPDALEAKGLGRHRARVEKVFAALSEANSVLSNKEKREELKALLEAGGTGRAGETAATVVRRALEAETLAREADRALRANSFARATEGFQQSLELHADQPDVVVSLAWCRFNLDGRSEQAGVTARRAIKEVLEKQPKLAKAHYFLGMILVAVGQDKLSIPSFEAAREHDPRLVDAERQLRAVRIRLQQSGAVPAPAASKPGGGKPAAPDAGGAFAGLRGMFGGKKS
jgi:tetratricopeptide (TPR) repeat protein